MVAHCGLILGYSGDAIFVALVLRSVGEEDQYPHADRDEARGLRRADSAYLSRSMMVASAMPPPAFTTVSAAQSRLSGWRS
jgi:hypothetical protein